MTLSRFDYVIENVTYSILEYVKRDPRSSRSRSCTWPHSGHPVVPVASPDRLVPLAKLNRSARWCARNYCTLYVCVLQQESSSTNLNVSRRCSFNPRSRWCKNCLPVNSRHARCTDDVLQSSNPWKLQTGLCHPACGTRRHLLVVIRRMLE
jgi:hypothetical protein